MKRQIVLWAAQSILLIFVSTVAWKRAMDGTLEWWIAPVAITLLVVVLILGALDELLSNMLEER